MGDGAEEVDPLRDAALRRSRLELVEQLAAAGDDDVDGLVAQLGQRVDRDVEALEVVGAVERGDEGGDGRVGGDSEALAQPVPSGPGENSSASTPFGISTSFAGLALGRCAAGTGPSSAWSAESTQTRSAARISAGATVCS